MRLWSIHPKYLDTKGLIALWRESLLAQKILEGSTRQYRNHPQLTRFHSALYPLSAIRTYLIHVASEARNRGYNFNEKKIGPVLKTARLPVTSGQIEYEKRHLLNKLKKRDPNQYQNLTLHKKIDPHPLFTVIPGPVEPWEKT
jgi:hypothetical protein